MEDTGGSLTPLLFMSLIFSSSLVAALLPLLLLLLLLCWWLLLVDEVELVGSMAGAGLVILQKMYQL